MYGLLIKAAIAYLQAKYPIESVEILEELGYSDQKDIEQFQIYSDKLISRISKVLAEKCGEDEDDLMEMIGEYTLEFMCKVGYQDMIYGLGRSLSDLMNELDNLHEYIKVSFPKLKAPSFICLKENADGMTLLYRSKRKGFHCYIIGLLKCLSAKFYDLSPIIEISSKRDIGDRREVIFRLFFDNTSQYMGTGDVILRDTFFKNKVIQAETIFDIYPFHILLNDSMEIHSVGQGLKYLYSKILREDFSSLFEILRPKIDPGFKTIQQHLNNMFEIGCFLTPTVGDEEDATTTQVKPLKRGANKDNAEEDFDKKKEIAVPAVGESDLILKGQMIFLEEWNCLIFFGFPMLAMPEQMLRIGLYVSDLSLFDSSRDLVMVAAQESSDQKMTKKLLSVKTGVVTEATTITEKTKNDWQRIQYALIPKAVSQRMMRGEPAFSMATEYERVTVIYAEITDERFDGLLGEIFPNIEEVHNEAAKLCSKYNFYKIDGRLSQFILLCGAPESISDAEQSACEAAYSLLVQSTPSMRIGIATGPLSVGVVGVKLLAYKPFGEAVKVARSLADRCDTNAVLVDDATQKAVSADSELKFDLGPELLLEDEEERMQTYVMQKPNVSASLKPVRR